MKALRSFDIARTDGHLEFERLTEEFPCEFSKLKRNFIQNLFRCLRLAISISDHDIYLSTGHAMTVLPLVLRKVFLRKKFILIVRSNDRFFHFQSFPCYQRPLLRWISRYIDGVIAVSEMVKQYVEQNTVIPVRKVNVFLRDETYLNIQPDLSSHNIIAIGTDYPEKGNDILVQIDKMLRERKQFRGSTFLLGHKQKIPKFIKKYAENQPRFRLVGYVEPKTYFAKSCFYVHPARFDAASLSVLEAMAAGLIPLISKNTGNKELVQRLNPELIVENNPNSFYQKISDLMNRDRSELERLSKKAKKIASTYTLDRAKRDFEKALMWLINFLENTRRTAQKHK